MLATSAHGSQSTQRHEALILWCCYPESSLPLSRLAVGSADATSSMVASRTNEKPTSSPPRNYIIGFPYTRPQTDDCRLCLFAPFPLFTRGFCQWGPGNGREELWCWRLWTTRKGRCVVVIVTVASPAAKLCSESWKQAQRKGIEQFVCVLRVMNSHCKIIDNNNDITVFVSRTLSSSSCCEFIAVRTLR